jgi:hypothetical protein
LGKRCRCGRGGHGAKVGEGGVEVENEDEVEVENEVEDEVEDEVEGEVEGEVGVEVVNVGGWMIWGRPPARRVPSPPNLPIIHSIP